MPDMVGRTYLERGKPVTVLKRASWTAGGPRNVLIRRETGELVVRGFRGLRKLESPCQDCGTGPGEPHEDNCDTARCMVTGMQRIQCGMGIPLFVGEALYDWEDHDPHPGEDCGQDIWSGQWPGQDDAVRLGWWSYFRPDFGEGTGWAQCGPEHPGATPDLNRLAISGKWNAELRRWEARDG